MAGLYVDTSALGRILLGEPDAAAIRAVVDAYDDTWSSELLAVELGRIGRRQDRVAEANQLLADISLVRITARLRAATGIDPVLVRTLDAIHLSAAVSLRRRGTIAAVLTFDGQLQDGCRHHAIKIEAPSV